MTRAFSKGLFAPASDRGKLPNWLIVLACLALLSAAIGYLLLKTYQFSTYPGFDFRYIWLAGDLWVDGINPYGDTYEPEGTERIASGHVPIKWVYPPSWSVLATPFGLLSLEQAAVAWNIFNLGLMLFSLALITSAFVQTFASRIQWLTDWTGAYTGALIFASLCFAIATLEATGIHFSVGQTSLLIGTGIAMMLFGRTSGRQAFEIAGLVIVLLKPQIGVPFAALLFLTDARSRHVVVLAGLGTIALMIPALVQNPGVILDFVLNVLAYDDFTAANKPLSTTGIRILIWETAQYDIGNMIASALTLLFIVGLCWRPSGLVRAEASDVRAWQMLGLAAALIAAFAPLHAYDLVLVIVPLLLILAARWQDWVIPALGVLLLWRSETLAELIGFHSPEVEIFPGSRLATIASIIFLVGIIRIVMQLNSQPPERGYAA